MDPDLASRILPRAGFAVRLLLLLLLLWGALMSSASFVPSTRTVEQFRGALMAGEIDRVSYRALDSGELVALVWSESPLTWHEVSGEVADSEAPYMIARLDADVDRAPVRPSVVEGSARAPDADNWIFPDWPFRIPGGPNLWWVAAAWIATFVAMLGFKPRLANRWAWFWLFTVGQMGAFLFLILEPRPLWKGVGEGVNRPDRTDGCSGCFYSILLSFVSVLVAVGVGQLFKLVSG